MDENKFTQEHTLITKGILVIMLLTHHVFYPENINDYGIITIIRNHETQNALIKFLGICVSGFAFLTAYGMCEKYKKIGDDFKKFLRFSISRLIKLESAVIIIYI